MKILYFGGGHQFFQISQGIKCLYGRGRKLIKFIDRGSITWDWGGNSNNLSTGEATRVHLTGRLGQGVLRICSVNMTKSAEDCRFGHIC